MYEHEDLVSSEYPKPGAMIFRPGIRSYPKDAYKDSYGGKGPVDPEGDKD